MTDYSMLFQPGNIGKLKLKNKLIMAPMGIGIVDQEGNVIERTLDYYKPRAWGGVGLATTAPAMVNIEATPPYALSVYDDKYIKSIKTLVDAVHEQGAKICVQIMHFGLLLLFGGGISEDMSIKVPSVIPWMVADTKFVEVTPGEIEGYIEDFAQAARRVRESGADSVELHACHGCLVSSFLSPVTNRRTDQWGGNVENRARFAQQIVKRIRELVGPDFPIIVRINATDDVAGGVSEDEVIKQAVILEAAGADAISLSASLELWGSLTIPCFMTANAPTLPIAEKVKKAIKIPVITAGKIHPDLAAEIIREDKADFVAVGRALLVDPEMPAKLKEGRYDEIIHCIRCNNCVRFGPELSCTVNPFMLRESRFPPAPAEKPKTVMVIGGGLAGMQAAILLKMRGHNVTLHEKEAKLGGQWNVASAMPDKKGFATLTNHLMHLLVKHEVPVELNKSISKDDVLKSKPDVVVLATGAVPLGVTVLGGAGPNVVQANDVITGAVQTGQKVVVVGGRFVGIEVAIMLTEQGKEVTLLNRSGLGGKKGPEEKNTFRTLVRRLFDLRIPLFLNTALLEITESSVIAGWGEDVFSLPVDTVVLAIGVEPVNQLAVDLDGEACRVFSIGDCSKPRHAASATFDAAKIASRI